MRFILPSSLARPKVWNTPGIAASGLVFTSGQVAVDVNGEVVAPGEVGPQTELIIRNIGAIMEDAGGALESVVQMTIFLSDYDQYEVFDAAYQRAFGDHKPARAVVSSKLLRPATVVEMQAIGVIESP